MFSKPELVGIYGTIYDVNKLMINKLTSKDIHKQTSEVLLFDFPLAEVQTNYQIKSAHAGQDTSHRQERKSVRGCGVNCWTNA